jgi:hypothetical protein
MPAVNSQDYLSHQPTITAMTGEDGRFFFKDVAPASYQLTVSADGYVPRYGPEARRWAPLINIVPGRPVNPIAIHLTPTGAVEGHVLEAGGEPLTGVPVVLWQYIYDPDGQRDVDVVGRAVTDDRGRYRIFWIPPGRYYLAAGGPSDFYSIGSEPEARGLLFYPGVADRADAGVVEVGPGIEKTIDWALPRFQTFSIRARVTDAKTGRPPARAHANIEIRTFSGDSESGDDDNVHYDRSSGVLEISDLLPGTYAIEITDEDGTGVAFEDQRVVHVVRIVDADVEGLVFDFAERSPEFQPIKGRIKTAGSKIPAMEDLQVVLRPEFGQIHEFDVDSNGSFQIPVIHDPDDTDGVAAGEMYRVSVSDLPDGWYVREAKLGGADALAAPVRIHGSSELEITLSPKAGYIEGVVNGADGKPSSGFRVVLTPALAFDRVDLFSVTNTDHSGHFSFLSVPPGDYVIYAWDGLGGWPYYDPQFLRRFAGKGSAVRVTESSKQRVTPTLLAAEEP